MQGLRVRNVQRWLGIKGQPVNQSMAYRDVNLLSELRYPKTYGFAF